MAKNPYNPRQSKKSSSSSLSLAFLGRSGLHRRTFFVILARSAHIYIITHPKVKNQAHQASA
jgi:hypothetical protein